MTYSSSRASHNKHYRTLSVEPWSCCTKEQGRNVSCSWHSNRAYRITARRKLARWRNSVMVPDSVIKKMKNLFLRGRWKKGEDAFLRCGCVWIIFDLPRVDIFLPTFHLNFQSNICFNTLSSQIILL